MNVERKQLGQLTYFAREAPKGWIKATLPFHRQMLRERRESSLVDLQQHLKAEQRQRWIDDTGVTPEESHFTIVMPIHNEEKSLSSALASFMLSDIPADTAATVVLITNGCIDNSNKLVEEFLANIGETQSTKLDSVECDPAMNTESQFVMSGNITFMHVDTATQGKANALNIGNTLALRKKHRIVLSLDANSYIEPQVPRKMFASAQRAIIDDQNNTVLFNAQSIADRRKSKLKKILERGKGMQRDTIQRKEAEVSGWCMAWDAKWIDDIGGIPQVAVEDYALGVKARFEGLGIELVPEAKVWGYTVNNVRDLVNIRSRVARGKMQIMHINPSVKDIVQSDSAYTRSFTGRAAALIDWIKHSPHKAPFYIGNYLLWEIALAKARRDYQNNPDNQSWDPIKSTK